MPPTTRRWNVFPRLTPEADHALHGYPPVLRQILFNRGIHRTEDASRFLAAAPPPGSEPLGMLGMPAAVERVRRAIAAGEHIAIYGDYDADGVTATALLVQALESLGARVTGYIPNRFDEGYGLNNEALTQLKESGASLVISVDCGIRSHAEAEHARLIGLDLIITDHHTPAETLPAALAVINPKQAGDTYPEKNLAGVGLAYKLAVALGCPPEAGLDLVAIGTVADMAPLEGENRSLVRAGLRQIQFPMRQGLRSLMGVAGILDKTINAGHIGFTLGPRLNASGRLDSALAALELLTTTDIQVAGGLAQKLDNQNRQRQELTRTIQEQAEQIATRDDPNPLLMFAAHPDFNPGVVGLAASRLTEAYYRPSMVGAVLEDTVRASCRSIPEFHITAALDRCADLLVKHGGHAAAAGFTVTNENLPALLERMNAIAREMLDGVELAPTLNADVLIPLSDLRPEILEWLEWLEPTGYGNPSVRFASTGLVVKQKRLVGADQRHIKLSVSDGRITYDAIGFGLGSWYDVMPARIDILYAFETNTYNGRTSMQLNLRDIRPTR